MLSTQNCMLYVCIKMHVDYVHIDLYVCMTVYVRAYMQRMQTEYKYIVYP